MKRRVRVHHKVDIHKMDGLFDSIGNAVSGVASGFSSAVSSTWGIVKSNPVNLLTLPVKIGIDGIKQNINAAASLYSASTGQQQQLLHYSTAIGAAIAKPSDLTSAIAAKAGGAIVNKVIPIVPILNQGIYAIQKSIAPNSINPQNVETAITQLTAIPNNSNIPYPTVSELHSAVSLFDKVKLNILTRGRMKAIRAFEEKVIPVAAGVKTIVSNPVTTQASNVVNVVKSKLGRIDGMNRLDGCGCGNC
jgi:hypothetical protein